MGYTLHQNNYSAFRGKLTTHWFISSQFCALAQSIINIMMTPSNGNIFRVTGHLCGEFTVFGHNIPHLPRHSSILISALSWRRHPMETFSVLLALCAGNSPVPVKSPHKGQWRGALMFSLICVWINGWVNNREAGDSRRYRTHYDVIVMIEA